MKQESSKSLTDLPPELLNHIIGYLPNADTVAKLSAVNKNLHSRIEETGWQSFNRSNFAHRVPAFSTRSGKSFARSLTSLSRAWDRRALVARPIAPDGLITTFPGAKQVNEWQPPKGQTMGFVPVVDAYCANDDTEVFAYSAGAQICIRQKRSKHVKDVIKSEKSAWSTYRPVSAVEGKDDVTAMQLIYHNDQIPSAGQQIITGTANGDLQHLTIPFDPKQESEIDTYFTTQGRAVKSLSIEQSTARLATVLGNDNIAIYPIDATQSKTAPISQLSTRLSPDGKQEETSHQFSTRVVKFVSPNKLAVGVGPTRTSFRVYDVLPTGLDASKRRCFGLPYVCLDDKLDHPIMAMKQRPVVSSIYAIHPAPESPHLIYSGAYDRTIHLHDLRSRNDVSLVTWDWLDDSAICSLLTKGPHMLLAGTIRHNMLKMFDIRWADRPYSYTSTPNFPSSDQDPERNHGKCRLYLNREFNFKQRIHSGLNTGSSIYSLASSSQASPTVYAGMQDGVVELAYTEMLHPHPDTYNFKPWRGPGKRYSPWNGWRLKSIVNVARSERERLERQRPLDATVTMADHKNNSPYDFRWAEMQNTAVIRSTLSREMHR